MNIGIWISLFLLFLLYYQAEKRKKQRHIIKKIKIHKKKGSVYMNEVIEKFIGKECIITTMSETVIGAVESVDDNWIVITAMGNTTGAKEIINIDYIMRIREYPKKKNGKKKIIISN